MTWVSWYLARANTDDISLILQCRRGKMLLLEAERSSSSNNKNKNNIQTCSTHLQVN